MNHCLFKAKDTKGAVGNTVDYSSLTYIILMIFSSLIFLAAAFLVLVICHKVL